MNPHSSPPDNSARDFEIRLACALRALPDQAAPPEAWARLCAALPAQMNSTAATQPVSLVAAGSRHWPRWPRWPRLPWPLALAASLLLGLGVLLTPQRPPAPVPTSVTLDEIEQLMARSATLEADLARLRPQAVVWDAGYARTARALEQQLAIVDVQLNVTEAPTAATPLWRDRVQLMTELVQTHQRAAGRMPATTEPQTYPQEWSL